MMTTMTPTIRPSAPTVGRTYLRLAIAGGGTGGHIQPGLHLLENLRARKEAPFELKELLWFGTGRSVEDRAFAGLPELLEGAAFERASLTLEPAGGGAPSLRGLSLRVLPAVQAARKKLKQHQSDVVLGLGGFTCLPVILAARSLGIPTALLEINAVRGRATRWLAPLVKRVFHAWPSTLPQGRTRSARDCWTGPPLASRFHSGRPSSEQSLACRAQLGFDPKRPLLVMLGGSQGAGGINEFASKYASVFVDAGVQVFLQAGPGKLDRRLDGVPGFKTVEYVRDVADLLTAADLVLCRGGASTLAELCGLARPGVVVPYPHHADQHQAVNAAQLGAGVRLVLEPDLSQETAFELCQLTSQSGTATRDSMCVALKGRFPYERPGDQILDELLRISRVGMGGPLLPENTAVQ